MKDPKLNYFAKPVRSLVFFLVCFSSFSKAQNSDELNFLEQKTVSHYNEEATQFNKKRAHVSSYNPIKLLGNSVMWVYQRVFSEQIMAECGFEPSCSSFAIQAINQRGLLMGVFLATDRLTRCNGAAQVESESYLVNKKTGKLQDEPKMYRISN